MRVAIAISPAAVEDFSIPRCMRNSIKTLPFLVIVICWGPEVWASQATTMPIASLA